MGSNVWQKSGQVRDLLTAATTTATGTWQYKDSPYSTYQATVTGTGAVSATVVIDVSNDGVNSTSTPMGTISLTGTTSSSDGFTSTAPWKYTRARVTAISGTGATINVITGT
jgi:hypothetical protein